MGVQRLPLTRVFGKTLAEDVKSPDNIPPFNRSAMDGFAINSWDRSSLFKIVEDIPAGRVPKKKIRRGECARIMTGAMLPQGTDKVVKVEDTVVKKCTMKIAKPEQKRNVSLKGEDIKKGKLVLNRGIKIRAQEIAMLGTVGKNCTLVLKEPKVAVISTGSELVEPGEKPKRGQIRNSNASMILAQLQNLGIAGSYLGIAKDNFKKTKTLIKKGLESDILILSGGVSVGDFDFVKGALKDCGVKIAFNEVSIKPGRPTVFGTKGTKLVFGLPGNPVSVLVTFELFVAPAIKKILGEDPNPKSFLFPILDSIERKDNSKEQYLPVVVEKYGATPVSFHGSGHIHALTIANGIARINKGIKKLEKGSLVNVRPI